jgi:cbb3-type cytochrome oxidase subunit 3
MELDTNLVRGLITAISLACFVAIAIWAWMPRNRQRFDQDARIPLDEPGAKATPPESGRTETRHTDRRQD